MFQTITTDLSEGIFTITINRPDKLNALNKDVISELATAIDEVYSNEAIKSVLLTGSGDKAFVAGADISEFTSLDAAGGSELAAQGQAAVFNKIENCPKPFVAAVNGFALGGGCELAMSCHFRTASESAKFGQPEVNLGLIPGYGGTQRLTQLIGKGKAMELMMTADMIGAEEAKHLGLVNHIYPAAELIDNTRKVLGKIGTKAPVAVSMVIACVNEAARCEASGFEQEISRFGACFNTADMREGTTAFLEKRKAAFSGK